MEVAEYLRVARDLKGSIIKGEFEAGDLLPSENELSQKYSLTRRTIRNALTNLEKEGLIYKKKGKGSIVKSKRKSFEILALRGFTEVMKSKGEDFQVDTQFVQPTQLSDWPEDFSWPLSEEEAKVGCIQMTRTRWLENQPVMLERTFLPNLHIDGFMQAPMINDSLFDTLIVNHDIEMTSVEQKIRAIPADDPLVDSLKISKNDPVLEVIRKLSTSQPHFHVYTYAYCNTKNFSVEM